jgi:hypothetical protein
MDLEPSALLASLVVSSIGFVLFAFGKRAQRIPQIVVGIALIAFPYFVGDAVWISVIAGVLVVGLWLATRFGVIA